MRDLAEVAIDAPAAAETSGRPQPRRRSVTVNRAESPIAWLFARGLIDSRRFEAGERVRRDYETAALGARITMRWDGEPRAAGRRGPHEPLDPTLAQIDAKRRFDAVLAAVGPGLSDILWRVVCAGDGLRVTEDALGWPSRSGKLVLGFALDRAADHYRLA